MQNSCAKRRQSMVRPQELRNLYNRCCDTKNYTPSKGQLEEWRQQLGHLETGDLDHAISEWFSNKPHFPAPSDLRMLAVKHQRSRLVRAQGPEELSCWECAECGTRITSFQPGWSPRVCSGYIPRGPERGHECVSRTFRLLFRDGIDDAAAGPKRRNLQILPRPSVRDKGAAAGDDAA